MSILMNGGRIFLKAGTHSLTAAIVDAGHNDVVLEGKGYSTVLDTGSQNIYALYLTNVGRWTVKNIRIQSAGTAMRDVGVGLAGCNNCTVENVWVDGTYGCAFHATGSVYLDFIGCRATNVRQNRAWLFCDDGFVQHHLRLLHCRAGNITGPSGYGFEFLSDDEAFSTTDILVFDFSCENCLYGMRSTSAKRARLTNFLIRNTLREGLAIYNSRDLVVENGAIEESKEGVGIGMWNDAGGQVKRGNLQDVRISHVHVIKNFKNGIHIGAPAGRKGYRIVIEHCNFDTNNQAGGAWAIANAERGIGNEFNGCETKISDSGTGTVASKTWTQVLGRG